MRLALAEHVPEIIAAMVAQAKAGDAGAARLLLERVIPPLKATEQAIKINLPAASLTEQGHAVLAATAAGEVTPGQGTALVNAIGALARVAGIDDVLRRLEALEGAQEGPNQVAGAAH